MEACEEHCDSGTVTARERVRRGDTTAGATTIEVGAARGEQLSDQASADVPLLGAPQQVARNLQQALDNLRVDDPTRSGMVRKKTGPGGDTPHFFRIRNIHNIMSYPWIKNSQDLPSQVPGYLAITAPNGLDMNSKEIINVVNINGSSYPPLVSTPTLAQVLVAGNTAGASSIAMNNNNISNIGQVSAQVALLTNSTSNTTLTVQSGSTTNTALLTKFYNQRTAVNGESITLDFKAKNGDGLEINYAKIHMDCRSTNVNDERGILSFDVVNTAASGLTPYFSCDGNAQQVNSFKHLNMNTNGISNITDAKTVNSSFLAPQKVDMLTANGIVPSTNLDLNMRYIACNTGVDATWVDSRVANFNGSLENVTASVPSFAGAWWVATDNGNLWSSDNSGASWNLHYSFSGYINCIAIFNGNFLAIGGKFTGNGFTNFACIDINYNLMDITNGYGGLNEEVKCFFDNTSKECLYIGGRFNDFNGNPGDLNTNAFCTYRYSIATWYDFDKYNGGGFLDSTGNVGTVNSICKDISSGFIIVGGNFYQIIISNSPSIIREYLFIFQTDNGYGVSGIYPYGLSQFSAPVHAVIDYNSSGVLVGGEFTSFGTSLYSYGILIVWNGSQWDINPYPFATPNYISSITQPALNSGINDIYTIYGGNSIYKNSTALPPIPVGTTWTCIAWNGTSILYATDAQPSAGFNFYILNTPTAINLTSVHPIKQYSTISYTNIKLLAEGSTVELIWNNVKSQWYILSYQGASFS